MTAGGGGAGSISGEGGAPTRTPQRQKRDSTYKRLKLSEIKQTLGDRMKTKLRRRISSDQVSIEHCINTESMYTVYLHTVFICTNSFLNPIILIFIIKNNNKCNKLVGIKEK